MAVRLIAREDRSFSLKIYEMLAEKLAKEKMVNNAVELMSANSFLRHSLWKEYGLGIDEKRAKDVKRVLIIRHVHNLYDKYKAETERSKADTAEALNAAQAGARGMQVSTPRMPFLPRS